MLFKLSNIAAGIGKPAGGGNFCHGELSTPQQQFGLVNPAVDQIAVGRDAHDPAEQPDKMILGKMH